MSVKTRLVPLAERAGSFADAGRQLPEGWNGGGSRARTLATIVPYFYTYIFGGLPSPRGALRVVRGVIFWSCKHATDAGLGRQTGNGEPGFASVAQRQSSGFVNRGLWVQLPPLACDSLAFRLAKGCRFAERKATRGATGTRTNVCRRRLKPQAARRAGGRAANGIRL